MRQAVSGEPSASKSEGKASASAPAKRTAAPANRPVSAEERKKQMSQLAEMGVAIPEEYRGDMALTGEWQTVSETRLDVPEGARSIGIRKRKLEGDEDEESGQIPEQYVSKGWGSRMKTYPGADDDGDDSDLDALLASTKELKKSKMETEAVDPKEQESSFSLASKKEEDDTADSEDPVTAVPDVEEPNPVKKEETDDSAIPIPSTAPESEEVPGVVFKKRKAKVMRK